MITIYSKTYFAFLIISLIGFSSCGKTKTDEKENTTPTSSIKDKSQNADQRYIEQTETALATLKDTIRSISGTLGISLSEDKNTPKEDALAILSRFQEKFQETTQKLDSLENSIKTNIPVIQGITNYEIEDMRKDLAQKNNLVTNLEDRVNSVQSKNVNLSNELKKAEKELIAKDDIISKIDKERKQQQQELDQIIAKMKDYEARIAEAERKLTEAEGKAEKIEKEAKQKIANTYYDAANEAVEAANNISGLQKLAGGGKTQKELYEKAYEYYIKAYESGFKPEAKNKICILETDHAKHISSKKICKK